LSEGLPHGTSYPRAGGLPLRFCKFSSLTHTQGIEEHHLIGATVRVYSPAKTVADCFKFRHKIGLDVAVEALRDGWREKKFTLEQLAESARLCRVRRVIQPYLEMLT
jgi:hypothetical protein